MLSAPRTEPYVRLSRIRLPPRVQTTHRERGGVCGPALVTRQRGAVSGTCFAELHSPWPRPLAPPTPRRIAPPRSPASQLLWPRPTSHLRASPATAPHLPGTDRRHRCQRPDVGSPSFRRAPFARDLLFDPSGAPVPRDNGTAHVAFGSKDSLRPRDKGISGLNHTPHATAVYASRPPLLSARATLASRRLATPYQGWTSTSGSRQLTGAVLCAPYAPACRVRKGAGTAPCARFAPAFAGASFCAPYAHAFRVCKGAGTAPCACAPIVFANSAKPLIS